MRQENKHFDIEVARKKRVCKRTSPKNWKFRKWYNNEFRPCLKNQCGYEIWQGPEMLGKVAYSQNLCYRCTDALLYSFSQLVVRPLWI